jgi:hypothetical protein
MSLVTNERWWLFWFNKSRWITIYPNIYHPEYIDLAKYQPVINHENVHLRQQEYMGLYKWLFKYIVSRSFRLDQEVEAIAVELKSYPSIPYGLLDAYAEDLSDSAYMWAASSKQEAVLLLTKAIS